MGKHTPAEEKKKDLDFLLSKVNALEVVSSDEYQKGVAKVLRALIEGQIHSITELNINHIFLTIIRNKI